MKSIQAAQADSDSSFKWNFFCRQEKEMDF